MKGMSMRIVEDGKKTESMPGFADQVARESGQEIEACYQCGKCTAGCPLAQAMDMKPNQVIRAVQLGLKDMALESSAVWYCAGCETCASRCPRDIDMSRVMKSLARMCANEGRKPKDPALLAFHRSFMESIGRWGRGHELEIIGLTKMRNAKQRFKDLPLGAALFGRGKLSILPHFVREGRDVRKIIAKDRQEAAASQEAQDQPAETSHGH